MKTVVLLSGKMRSGKNTFADILIEELTKQSPNLTVKYDFFAKPVKDQCKEVFSTLTKYLNMVSSTYDIKELYTDEDNWYEDKNEITRILLQTYGTEIFREKVDKNYWSNLMKRSIESSTNDVIIITDLRFKNEIEIIKSSLKFNTISVRIDRPELVVQDTEIHQHSSEIDLDDYDGFDASILNTSFDALRDSSKDITKLILDSYKI
jgi:adenosyl cobinamide kinase/adenosyl cobinamide phosphate guanylyltransferase